jgi:uncharacterized Fe-S cluster-containing protein
MSQNYVLACDKDSVYLSRDKAKYMYLIEFNAVNPKIHIDALLTFDIYKMMYELNKDLFESHHIAFPDPNDPSRAELLFIFKSIMGLGERYTHVYTHMPHLSNQEPLAQGQGQVIHISSSNVPKTAQSQLRHLISRRAEQIDSDNSHITIHVQPDRHAIQFYYEFKLQLSKPDDVISIPPFVDKAVSTMMKNIFVRMKQFIECLG